MTRTPSLWLLVLTALGGALGCDAADCPVGTRKAGPRCQPIETETEPATLPDAAAGEPDAASAGPPDAATPDASVASCLADHDGDGFGVEGLFGPCHGERADAGAEGGTGSVLPGDCDDGDVLAYPDAPRVLCDQVDNDCDGEAVESASESCNGEDDDCDGQIDNGVANACGGCGELPVETCNGIDDDCDGVVDPHGAFMLGQAVHTQGALSVPPTAGQVALLEREGYGAWFLYRAYERAHPEQERDIRVVGLDAEGAVNRKTVAVSNGATTFVAASDGKWVALLVRQRPEASAKNDSVFMTLQLFRASDMSFVSEYFLARFEDDDGVLGEKNDVDDCDDVEPWEVSVFEDNQGAVHVAAAYQERKGITSGTSCGTLNRALLISSDYSAAGIWTKGFGTNLHAASARDYAHMLLQRVPCRDEWFALYRSNEQRQVSATYTLTGESTGANVDAFQPQDRVTAVATAHAICDATTSLMVLSYVRDDVSYLRRWKVGKEDGATRREGDDVPIGATALVRRIAHAGGRWFLAGSTYALAGGTLAWKPRLWEYVPNSTGAPVREHVVFTGAANPGAYEPNQSSLAVIDAGSNVVVAARDSFYADSNLDEYRGAGNSDPAVAVTYQLGCE